MSEAIDFSSYIAERTQNFSGRGWVFHEISEWLANPAQRRYFLLTGAPGSGKTAISARLAQLSSGLTSPQDGSELRQGWLSAVHFCWAQDRRWINPRTFSASLAAQLAESGRYPEFAKALVEKSSQGQTVLQAVVTATGGDATGLRVQNLNVGRASEEDTFSFLVREPLEALIAARPELQMVILVDALDESLTYTDGPGIVALLANLRTLPNNVYFVLTSREDDRVVNEFGGADLELSAPKHEASNVADLKEYVASRWNSKDLRSVTESLSSTQSEEMPGQIASKGNFLYVRFLLDSLGKGLASTDEMSALPAELDGLYLEFFNRAVKAGGKNWQSDYAPLIGTLSVAEGGLTIQQLRNFTRQPESVVRQELADMRQFLQENPTYRLYHESVREFFRRERVTVGGKSLRNTLYLPEREQHQRITTYYRDNAASWGESAFEKFDDYGLHYLTEHLYALRDEPDFDSQLSELINRRFFETKRVRFGSDEGFARDVRLLIAAASKCDPPKLSEEVRGYAILSTLNSQASNIPQQTIAALVRAGDLDTVHGLMALRHKADDYLTIADVNSRDGRSEDARWALKRAQELAPDAEGHCAIAVGFKRAGFAAAARDALFRALAMLPIPRMPQTTDSSAFRSAAKVSVDLGEVEAMLDFIDKKTRSPAAASRARAELADALVTAGQKEQARKLLKTAIELASGRLSLNALARCVIVLMRLDDRTQGLKIADRISKELKQPRNKIRRDAVNGLLSQAFVYMGDFGRAEQLAKGIGKGRHKDRALSVITGCYARQAEIGPAIAAARKTSERTQGAALADIVQVQAESGQYGPAISLTQKIEGISGRIAGWSAIGDVLSREPDHQKARASLELVIAQDDDSKPHEEHAALLAAAALGYAGLDDKRRALELARKSIDASRGPLDRGGLVSALCRFSSVLQECDREYARTAAFQAYNYALDILDEAAADQALSEVAVTLSRLGDSRKSKKALERIADEGQRDEARKAAKKSWTAIAEEEAEYERIVKGNESSDNADDLKRALDWAASADSEDEAVSNLMEAAELALHLGDESAPTLARQVFLRIENLQDKRTKIETLVGLIGVYNDVAPQELAKRALALIPSTTDPLVLTSIAPKLVDYFGSQVFLELVEMIHDGPTLVDLLDAATDELIKNRLHADAVRLWRRNLSADLNLSRWRMNSMLQVGAPVLFSIDQGKSLRKICENIIQVETWWGQQTTDAPEAAPRL